jgi:hypothetical protein
MAPRGPGAHLPSLVADAAAAAASHWSPLLRKSRPAAAAAATVAAAAAASVAVATATRNSTSTTTTPPTAKPSSSDDDEQGPAHYERAVSKGLRACARESHAYGRCAAGYLPDAAPKGACEREFAALRRCFLAASGLGRWRDEGGGGSKAAESEQEQLSGGRPARRA